MEKLRLTDEENLEFELVDKFPKGYEVWHINVDCEYLPLCEINKDKNDFNVNIETLKCVKLESAEKVQDVLKGMMYVRQSTSKGLQRYLKRYSNKPMSAKVAFHVKRITKALEALKGIEIE